MIKHYITLIKEIIMKINIKKALAATLAVCAMTSGAVIPSAGTSLLTPKAVTASAANSTVIRGDFTYSYGYDVNYGGYVAAINKYSGTSSKPSIPASIQINNRTYKVFGIEQNAFARNNSVTEITIPEGCIMIGEGAFRECKNLKKVNFSSTLNTIYSGAFYMCSSLAELSNVRNDGNYNFQPRAFYGCTNLKKINGSNEVWRTNNDVYLTHENLVKKCFSADETVGFIQEYVNGKAAFRYYQKYALAVIGREAGYLPSTSPANASWSTSRLTDAWKCIKDLT